MNFIHKNSFYSIANAIDRKVVNKRLFFWNNLEYFSENK